MCVSFVTEFGTFATAKTFDHSRPYLYVLELKTEKQRWVWDCAFTADSQYMATASSDNAVRFWSISGGEPKIVQEFKNGHLKAVTALALSDTVIDWLIDLGPNNTSLSVDYWHLLFIFLGVTNNYLHIPWMYS